MSLLMLEVASNRLDVLQSEMKKVGVSSIKFVPLLLEYGKLIKSIDELKGYAQSSDELVKEIIKGEMSSVNDNTVDGIVLKMRYLSYLEYLLKIKDQYMSKKVTYNVETSTFNVVDSYASIISEFNSMRLIYINYYNSDNVTNVVWTDKQIKEVGDYIINDIPVYIKKMSPFQEALQSMYYNISKLDGDKISITPYAFIVYTQDDMTKGYSAEVTINMTLCNLPNKIIKRILKVLIRRYNVRAKHKAINLDLLELDARECG